MIRVSGTCNSALCSTSPPHQFVGPMTYCEARHMPTGGHHLPDSAVQVLHIPHSRPSCSLPRRRRPRLPSHAQHSTTLHWLRATGGCSDTLTTPTTHRAWRPTRQSGKPCPSATRGKSRIPSSHAAQRHLAPPSPSTYRALGAVCTGVPHAIPSPPHSGHHPQHRRGGPTSGLIRHGMCIVGPFGANDSSVLGGAAGNDRACDSLATASPRPAEQ